MSSLLYQIPRSLQNLIHCLQLIHLKWNPLINTSLLINILTFIFHFLFKMHPSQIFKSIIIFQTIVFNWPHCSKEQRIVCIEFPTCSRVSPFDILLVRYVMLYNVYCMLFYLCVESYFGLQCGCATCYAWTLEVWTGSWIGIEYLHHYVFFLRVRF